MYSDVETEQFARWLGGLKRRTTRARLQLRLRKASLGNLRDIERAKTLAQELRNEQVQDPSV